MSKIKCFLLEPVEKDPVDGDKVEAPMYQRVDTGELMTYENAPVGAMVRALWCEQEDGKFKQGWTGLDGKAYVVKTPGGDWYIDSRAGNCDSPCKNCGKPYAEHMKGDGLPCKDYVDAKPHTCWCRHGEAPNLTVDKACSTCNAGAGSIQIGDLYHGFLTNGELTNC